MHELGIALGIVDACSERAAGAHVARVIVEVGKLSLVLPDALRFCFPEVAQGSPLEGATLEIRELPGEGRCRACAGLVVLERPLGQCACGSTDLEWTKGEELRVVAMELV